jgi:hypothetical protein
MTEQALFSGEDVVNGTIAAYEARMAAVRERYDAYHPDCTRRYVADEYRNVSDRIRGARAFLAGEYDRTYPGDSSHVSFGGLNGWRVHYADDAVRTALHHLVWAEHYAGLRDRESARSEDPFTR